MLLELYHRLPPSARSLVASARGYYLSWLRYGPDAESLISGAFSRERWSWREWQSWQGQRLDEILVHAATQVPHYRHHWLERRRRGDNSSWEALENWPILEKEKLRGHSRDFLADDHARWRLTHEHTSGSTGKPVDFWLSRTAIRSWYALHEARSLRWHGVRRYDRWGMLGGQLIAPVRQRKPPFWVWNAGLRQLYLSSYHLSPSFIPHYLDAMQQYRVSYLFGYSSSLYLLAQEAVRLNRRDVKLRVVVTNAEPLFDYQREVISAAFSCPVRETYGLSENVMGSSECEAGRLHHWPEVGVVEILQGNSAVPPGEVGDIVCTGLLNRSMPLIRYRIGDRGALEATEELCACGRRLPTFARIEGRIDDVLYTSDGRAIGRLDPVFKSDLPIREAQIIQESLGRVRVRYVPTPEFTGAAGQSIIDRLRQRLGPMDIVLEAVNEIPRSANGKFRAVICEVPREQRKAIQP